MFEYGKEYNLACSLEITGFQFSSHDYDPLPPIVDPREAQFPFTALDDSYLVSSFSDVSSDHTGKKRRRIMNEAHKGKTPHTSKLEARRFMDRYQFV